jgi:hypothetical protein
VDFGKFKYSDLADLSPQNKKINELIRKRKKALRKFNYFARFIGTMQGIQLILLNIHFNHKI